MPKSKNPEPQKKADEAAKTHKMSAAEIAELVKRAEKERDENADPSAEGDDEDAAPAKE